MAKAYWIGTYRSVSDPEKLAAYARQYRAGSDWTFLTGTPEASVAAQRAFGVYRGDKIGAGKKSLAYSLTYQASDKTLSDKDVAGIRIVDNTGQMVANHSYFPILVEPPYSLSRDALYERMKEHGIFARRYFDPLISEFPMYRGMPSAKRENLPVAGAAAQQVLCLPIHPGLDDREVERIAWIVRGD